MNIATVASETVWKDCKANLELTKHHVATIMSSHKDIAEPLDGHCVSVVKDIAKEYGVALICGFIESNPNGLPFNAAVAISKDGEPLAVYRKNHLFTESAEPNVFSPGTELVTFELDGWKCGMSTCFDIRFPRLFEAYRRSGVELMFSGFNWVEGRNKPSIMEHLVKARAHENQYFFAAVDRTGSDPNTSYYGTSVIANPYSEDIAERDGIYAFASLDKSDIHTLAKALPLSGSFKQDYKVS